jgi:hypothetical protein
MVWLAKFLPSVCHVEIHKDREVQNNGNKTGAVVGKIFQFHHCAHKYQYHRGDKKVILEFVHGSWFEVYCITNI